MDATRARPSSALVAKAALRRLAQAQQEPTPENYARAYEQESGQPAAAPDARQTGVAWAQLVERLAKHLQRGGRQWTAARRKDSLQRVLEGSHSDPQLLLQRLQSLITAWESDQPGDAALSGIEDPTLPLPAPRDVEAGQWPPIVAALESTVRVALSAPEPRATELATRLGTLADAVAADGAQPEQVRAIAELCEQARGLLGQGHRRVDRLASLCRELTDGMAELSEDQSWVRGQCQTCKRHSDRTSACAA